ncbi:hypothetical protein [Photorhabdus sp. RM71S]|uniref:hypothetical protein n=1 Tax=Photorhabdus sp. RM71S TaxID=3342824 RepID=UPI0036DDCDED
MLDILELEHPKFTSLLCDYSDSEKITINLSIHTILRFAKENKTTFPYQDVVRMYHKTGKHFVPEYFIELLNITRKEYAKLNREEIEQVTRFLNVLLDKYDGTYDYRSYLALELLNMPDDQTGIKAYSEAQSHIDRMTLLLTADLLKFELGGLETEENFRHQLPERTLVEKRCAMALKAVTPYVQRAKLSYISSEYVIESAKHFIAAVEQRKTHNDEQMLMTTNLPVYLIHDEYMFIRVLQTFEYTFSWIAVGLREAIEACADSPSQTSILVESCEKKIKEAIGFFHLLSSMRAESFKVFRAYTEGASAIQSRNYKRIESLCRQPDEDRLNSIAYGSVPEVQEKLLARPNNLDLALSQAQQSGRFNSNDFGEVKQAMKSFATTLKRWKQTHYGLAMKMLGEGSGTGYTEGTPYLAFVKDIPVFETQLDE